MEDQKKEQTVMYPTLSTLETFIFDDESQMQQIKKALEDVDFIVGVSRGGLIPAALIATRLDIPLVSIYVNKKDEYSISCDHLDWLENKRICIVDDIIRSGKTMEDIMLFFATKNIADAKVLVLFSYDYNYSFKEKIVRTTLCPKIIGESTRVEFLWDTKIK